MKNIILAAALIASSFAQADYEANKTFKVGEFTFTTNQIETSAEEQDNKKDASLSLSDKKPVTPKVTSVYGGNVVEWYVNIGLSDSLRISYTEPECEREGYVEYREPSDNPLSANNYKKVTPSCDYGGIKAKVDSVFSDNKSCSVGVSSHNIYGLLALSASDYDKPITIYYKCTGNDKSFKTKTVSGRLR